MLSAKYLSDQVLTYIYANVMLLYFYAVLELVGYPDHNKWPAGPRTLRKI